MVMVRVCTLFRYVWKNWSKCLRFRHRTQHAVCRSCFEFKAAIRHAKSIQAQAEAQFEYLEHLNHQYRDRLVYWQLRERAIHNKDLICMIHDGMDRAKFRMPRWGGSGSGKSAKCANPVESLSFWNCAQHCLNWYFPHNRSCCCFYLDCLISMFYSTPPTYAIDFRKPASDYQTVVSKSAVWLCVQHCQALVLHKQTTTHVSQNRIQ
jgi:hypothetical protein